MKLDDMWRRKKKKLILNGEIIEKVCFLCSLSFEENCMPKN
jgi:hypothetical protein